MTSHEFWLGVIFVGGIVGKQIATAILKWAWSKFVRSSRKTIEIWWSHKKRHAEQTIDEATRIIGGSNP